MMYWIVNLSNHSGNVQMTIYKQKELHFLADFVNSRKDLSISIARFGI